MHARGTQQQHPQCLSVHLCKHARTSTLLYMAGCIASIGLGLLRVSRGHCGVRSCVSVSLCISVVLVLGVHVQGWPCR